MAQPQLIQESYRAGMKRDAAREAMPDGSCWNLVDFFPEVLGAVLRKRGGYRHASYNLSASNPTTAWIKGGIVADFVDGQSVLAFDQNGHAFEIESLISAESIGAGVNTRQQLFFNDTVIILGDGTNPPWKITRAGGVHTLALLATAAGSATAPPVGKYGLIYKDVVWIGGSVAFPKRTWFSLATEHEKWDTNVKWVDMSYPITGYAALSNAVLVFSLGRTARIRGSEPPPGGDFTVDDPVFEVGCTDSKSIVNYRDKCIFANAQGLYMTDGVALEDLTRVCGMKGWWRDIMTGRAGFAAEGAGGPTGVPYDLSWTIAGGIYDDFYFYSIMAGTGVVDAGMIDLTRYAWTRINNLGAGIFFDRLYPQELFWGQRNRPYVSTISDMFNPTATNSRDGDDDPVIPILETSYSAADPGMKTFKTLFLTYDLTRDLDEAIPSLRVSYALDPEAASYTALAPDLGANGHSRAHLEVNQPGLGLALKLTQVQASLDTRLHTISLDAQPREKSR